MHNRQDLSNTDLTLYDDRLTDDERNSIRKSRNLLLFFWFLNLLVVIYIAYRLISQYESFFVGYVLFSIIALLASLLYAVRYNTWYGHNILIGFILILFILTSIVFFALIIIVEYFPIKELEHLKRGHDHWLYSVLTVISFLIPVLHSLMIICLWWQRSSAEARIARGRKSNKEAKGRLSLSYKPQVDDNEKNLFAGARNMQ